jgi:Holliday junction resolvase RusA-like endonuclease
MAKHVIVPMPTSTHDNKNWEAEEDQRTMIRAAEIMADRARIASVIRAQKRSRVIMGKLETLLASRRMKGRRGGRYQRGSDSADT